MVVEAGWRRGTAAVTGLWLPSSDCPPHPGLAPAEAPSAPSEYARAAAQTVLAPVLQGLRGLSCDAQALVLSQVTAAFLEVWMDHILAQKIKFR